MKRIVLIICLIVQFIQPLSYPATDSKIVEIYDLTDEKVIYEVGSQKVVSIASLTKIATTITAIESIKDLDEKITITRAMLSGIRWDLVVAGLKVGDKVTYRDLLYASMLPSGADATHSIAVSTSGSVANYVAKMNKLAERIGLKNTHFVNVTGLDAEDHHSTADDVRRLLQYALQDPEFRKVFTTKEYTMTNGMTVRSTLYRYGAGSKDAGKILGSKSGYTGKAGYCLAALSDINGHEMLTIVLHASKENHVVHSIQDTVTLIDFLKDNFREEVLLEKGTFIRTISVYLSDIEEVNIYSDRELRKYLPSDYDREALSVRYDGPEELSYRNQAGDMIGTVSYYYGEELLYTQEIFLDVDPQLSVRKFAEKYSTQLAWLEASVIFILCFFILTCAFYIRKAFRKRQ